MNFEYKPLKVRIRRYYGNQVELAKSINLSATSLNMKLNNKRFFTQDEIMKMIDRLDIKKTEIKEYFFTLKV